MEFHGWAIFLYEGQGSVVEDKSPLCLNKPEYSADNQPTQDQRIKYTLKHEYQGIPLQKCVLFYTLGSTLKNPIF